MEIKLNGVTLDEKLLSLGIKCINLSSISRRRLSVRSIQMRISSPRIVAINGGERMSLAFGSAIITNR